MSPISVMSRSGSDLLEGDGAALRSASSVLRFFACLKGRQNCCAPEPVEKDRGAHEEGASEAVVCRVADFDVELARMASTAVSSLDDPAKLAEIDACYDSTFHMHEEHVHMANTSGAGP